MSKKKSKKKKALAQQKRYEKNQKKIEDSGLVSVDKNRYLCPYCGNVMKIRRKLLVKNPICRNCMSGQSFGENRAIEILKKYGIQYEKEKTFSGLKGVGHKNLRFDFYIIGDKRNFLIEIDGEQHTRDTDWALNTKTHDDIKNEFCKKKNIKLYRIIYKFGKLGKLENQLMKVLELEFSELKLMEFTNDIKQGKVMSHDEIAAKIEELKRKKEGIIPKDIEPLEVVETGMEVTVRIPIWLCKKNGYNNIMSGSVKRVTEKAILLRNDEEYWLPKSYVKVYEGIYGE